MAEGSTQRSVAPTRGAKNALGAFTLLLAGLVAAGLASLCVGSVPISIGEAIDVLADTSVSPQNRTIILDLRLPRVLLAMAIGMGLGVSGCAYQALFRNPLADPFVIGASSGAAAGATAVIVLGWSGAASGFGPASAGAFAGSLLAVGLVYGIGAVGKMPPVTLLLAGSAVSTMFVGAVWLMMALGDRQLHQIVSWLMGGLAGRGWDTLYGAVPLIAVGTIMLCLLGRPLDAICCGEEVARSLGLRVGGLMAVVLLAGSISVAAAVAAGGVIGFVGLIAPHLARPMVGRVHARLIPASGAIGAGLLLAADAVARTIIPPLELPIGVITAVIGGPVFLWVLHRESVRMGEGRG